MSETTKTAEQQMQQILLGQEKALSVAVRHERRLAKLHQEFAQAATVIYRLKLASDIAKSNAQRREAAIEDLANRLSAIEAKLAALSG